MPRTLRSDLPDGFFHAMARGVDGLPIYRDDDDRRVFDQLLVSVVRRFEWRPHALCLMGNHYHLVVESTRSTLSAGMQILNGEYAARFNHKYGRRGHLFGGRFASVTVEDERQLAAACRYVIYNPVRAGLCEHPREWRWSWCRFGLELG